MLSLKTFRRIALILILIVPFLLREYDGRYEPYPAILLPSGGKTAPNQEGTITFGAGELLVILEDGSEQKLDSESFFGIIPIQYLPSIRYNHFGLEPRTFKKSLGTLPWKINLSYEHEATPDQRRETLNWIRKQLTRQGITDARTLRIRWLDVAFDIKKGIESEKTIKRQYDIQLDQ
ncbi:MAG: hypothetical protein GY940_16975 [bacterium]|nr:hypothetical protein [bacterium]